MKLFENSFQEGEQPIYIYIKIEQHEAQRLTRLGDIVQYCRHLMIKSYPVC